MPKKKPFFFVILFSIIWIVSPISYYEMLSQHPIGSQESQALINKSSIFSFKRKCSTLEDFFLKQMN
jgi:hypothetical protein